MEGSVRFSPDIRLAARGLACRRGDRLLVRGLALDLAPGTALHLVGANGTGKTTLIRTLAGLMRPYAGEVEAAGAIGLVDERPALDPDLPLGRALGFWQRIDRCPHAGEIHARLGLARLLDVPVRYLSTGQKKRAALAALMGREAPIWLLDEPLSGLDAGAIGTVTDLVAEHVARGGIALVASHQKLAVPGLQSLAIEDYAPREEPA
ncbi:heme ABC exporter ATP-binding protein CcmA [Erythrobacter sp. HL-111]|uniref:heme ABC exporter ATP-binding protein CcmA n=1 Tax=Erythrobacter sp. HL-111 TaxID=1798193 RepID=UPI0006DAE80A|nr:heme ABC exporter ATP-binding protein CcmA [Erythrobacter sp. HL-111]KPP90475.1 MAG: ABC-type heme export system ATPase component CcmA [Erythrobacteraceae bacterium HL-111]SDT12472.1 heme exporter protein A [Erythrobacter sp. HL-111]